MENTSSSCPSAAVEQVIRIVARERDYLEDREEIRNLYDMLGSLRRCKDEMPADERKKLLEDVAVFCGLYRKEHNTVTYAQVARLVRPLLKEFLIQ